MKVKIKEHELELVYSIRTNILYESIMNKQLQYEELNKIDNLSYLFYANIMATLQANKLNADLSWDEYIDYLDANGGIKILGDYATWLMEQMNIQAQLISEELKSDDEKKVKKTKKKS